LVALRQTTVTEEHLLFSFEKLDVWNEAIAFAATVYRISRGYPPEERFGLTGQIRRAAVSVSANLAEGTAKSSRKDFARFIEIATGSLYEVVSESTIARDQGFQTDEDHQTIYRAADKLSRMLSGLRNSIQP
jgi:four helix bundle protein